jgi:predicted ATPase
MAQMRQGLAAWRATGAEVLQPYFLALLAEAEAQAGQAAAGLRVLAHALTAVAKTGERWYEAELHRLQGELLLRQTRPNEPHAESCFHEALDVARRQQAKSLELRAAMSLSRLRQRQVSVQKPTGCWHRSTGGSPKGLTPETYKRPKRSCMIWGVAG